MVLGKKAKNKSKTLGKKNNKNYSTPKKNGDCDLLWPPKTQQP